jgi:Uma2 family endonuclease
LLQLRNDFYASATPTPGDVFLLIEIADSSTARDRQEKIPLYARYGIQEVWLIDLPAQQVIIYRQPSRDGYRSILRPANTESIAPSLLPTVSLPLAELWTQTGQLS